MGNILYREGGPKIMDEPVERGLVEQIESIVLGDDELNHMLDKAPHRERGYAWLARNHPI
jgi:hypothetical protein